MNRNDPGAAGRHAIGPCPWCGNVPEPQDQAFVECSSYAGGPLTWAVYCASCEAQGPAIAEAKPERDGTAATRRVAKAKAVEAWNAGPGAYGREPGTIHRVGSRRA